MNSELSIMLVEDDTVDVMTVKRAFKKVSIDNTLHVAGNGCEALEQLRGEAPIRPGLILLDLNMPRMNGIEFLTTVKSDPELRGIPVIVLTSSTEERDMVESYDLSVAGYLVKPVNFDAFLDLALKIDAYWSLCVRPRDAAVRTAAGG